VSTIRDLVDAQAAARPSVPFVLSPETASTLTYADLRAVVRSIAVELDAHGIGAGEPVAFMLPNGLSAVSLFLGVMYAGRVVAPQNLLAQDSHLEYALAHSGTRLLFTSEEHAPRMRSLVEHAKLPISVRVCGLDGLEPLDAADTRLAKVESSDPALLMYTSGTTGLPKGAVLTHANLLVAGRAVAQSLALSADDRVLSSLPLYHVNGQCIATVTPLVAGGSIVMPHRFSVSSWWSLVERYRPTWLNVVPTIISYLLNAPDPTAEQARACRGVRFARSASAPLPPAQHRAFETRFGIAVIEAMGLTECASVAFTNGLEPRDRRIGSPGRPLAMEARVARADGGLADVGETGEIELRGGNVMRGYFKAPELTARTIDADGWLATGDLGYRDADGFYFVTGRLKELIIKGGENIAPREVDEALLRHPAVLECAAVGVPDADYGQEILACVVLKPGVHCAEEDLRAHCLRELGRYKSPRYLRFVAELPKGPSGKVQRLKLLETAG